MDLRALEEELKKLGVSIVSGRQETIFSIRIKGLAGKALDRGLRLCDQLLHEKVKNVVKTCTDPSTRRFADPTFGPREDDPQGAAALCKTGTTIPSKGGSQHQMKVLALLKADRLRWERPEYAVDEDAEEDSGNQVEDYDESSTSRGVQERVFAPCAKLFSDGVSSGDVIQGNLGDCWFLSALSVVATRSDLLEQAFWRGDKNKSIGLFVCKFMKNFVWHYVVIDDRLPVYGFSKTREGKPYFARCRDPNELWVALLEKAYAKLHGSFEALIGGFVDVALNDLTGMCSEQVILKPGYPGFGEDPFAPARTQQRRGDPFWDKLQRYRSTGSLMGCSIQPAPASADKNAAAESSAGNGLYFKHAYALVDAAEIKTTKNELIKLLKLRNPWGMGEWTGPWSDASDERTNNHDVIEQFFRVLKRKVGANINKRVFLSLNGKGELKLDEISQEEVVEVNANDGTFFMSYDAWMQYFTHFFAGIDFPDEWHGRRVEGYWDEATCGGNTTKSTWINNPRFELVVQERSQFFISLSQEDPRGKENLKIVPIGFHICTLTPVSQEKSAKCELKEPPGKDDAYYRLYKDKDRIDFKKGARPEQLPPAIIPGSVIKGIDEDGVPQPAYTFKQAVSVDLEMEPGRYCILPSMYMRTDKDTGKTNVGGFWVSVYSNKLKFSLEGGERIVEEEEGDEDDRKIAVGNNSPKTGPRASFMSSSRLTGASSPGKKPESPVFAETVSVIEQRRRFEDAKEELLAQAKAKGIGLRQLKVEFAKTGVMRKLDMRRKMLSMGFKPDELSDEKINIIFNGLDNGSKGSIEPESILNLFEAEIHEDQLACEIPEVEDDEVVGKVHDEGVLSLELRGARDLPIMIARASIPSQTNRPVVRLPAIEYSTVESKVRKQCAMAICESNPTLANAMRPLLRRNGWLPPSMKKKPRNASFSERSSMADPVAQFYRILEDNSKLREPSAAKESQQEELATMALAESTVPVVSLPSPSRYGSTSMPEPGASVWLHKSNRMQSLEDKRCRRLTELRRKKQETLGDRTKAVSLPRLIGGRKSGSTFVQCSDCGQRVLVPGRAGDSDGSSRDSKAGLTQSYTCSGSQCLNVLCSPCYLHLPPIKKVCEVCFEHELMPAEVFGSQLRALLIDKIGDSKDQRTRAEALFRSIDKDNSGALSYEEFASAMASLEIQPPLTDDQLQSLTVQFDTNKDGEISISEFRDWVFQDQIWQPGVFVETASTTGNTATPDVRSGVIAPLVDLLLDTAFQAHMAVSSTSQWMITTNSAAPHSMRAEIKLDAQSYEESETGSIIFQRVQMIKMATFTNGDNVSAMDSSIDQVFERYDADGSGQMDVHEFRELLSTLGLQLSESDALLLMRRVESTATLSGTVDLAEFRSFVHALMGTSSPRGQVDSPCYPLVQKLLALDTLTTSNATTKEWAQDILQQLHWNLRPSRAVQLRALIRKRLGISLPVSEIQRLSNVLHFREVVPTISSQPPATEGRQTNGAGQEKLLELNSSGDVLNYLLFTSPGRLAALKTFNLQAVCAQIGRHLESVAKTASPDGVWKTVFGMLSTLEPMDQRVFLDKLLFSGYLTPFDSADSVEQRLTTKLVVALALDALRCEAGEAKSNDEWSWSVPFSLFTVLMHHSTIDAIEKKFAHALRNYMQLCQGNQSYLVNVVLRDETLTLQAIDPTHKYRLDFVLSAHEYSQLALAQLGNTVWPRGTNTIGWHHRAFSRNPGGLITATTHPLLHDALVTLISRLRIGIQTTTSSQHTMTPYLTLVEDDAFVQTLETMFTRARLPFFWSVSPTTLEFSIDSDYLTHMKRLSFHQLIVETLSTKPAAKPLYSLLKFTKSSLSVRYEIIGQSAVFGSSWADFQALLSGHQNTFAVLELRPQGDSFVTAVDRTGGNGAPVWNFKTLVSLKEPERIDHRMDRPVVFSDTVRVSAVPDGSTLTKITFSPVTSSSGKATSVGHFVVLSVRKAVPERHGDKARLYCTAYDPFTSSDFAVEGCPANWEPDFFNATTHPDCEERWIAAVKDMHLGPVLTPKVVVKVYTKHTKVEQLMGECEISISSAIAHDGHVFDDWFPLTHPSDASKTAGAINLVFCFDSKKLSDINKCKSAKIVEVVSSVNQPVNAAIVSESRAAGTVLSSEADRQRRRELERALEQCEASRREAHEQARQLKAQLQHQASRTLAAADESNEVSRWKIKLEQVRREQEAEQNDHTQRLAALQAELLRLQQEQHDRDNSHSESPIVIPTNLKQASLGVDASALDILSTMKDILVHRSPDRPYNGLKKAMAAVAELPGKVAVAAFDDVLGDFGLSLSTAHRKCLLNILDWESKGRINIEDFFIKLSGDAEVNRVATPPKTSTFEPSLASEPLAVPASPPRSASTMALPAPTRPPKMSWKEMKKLLILNLPEGWETRYTEKGRPYFCNHANRSTQWKHPLPEVEAKYSEWVKENGANFQRLSNTATSSRR